MNHCHRCRQWGDRLTRNDSAKGLTTYTYDDHDRLLTEVLTCEDGTTVHTITHSYDDNGNLISRVQETDGTTETTTYTWNDDDRLVAVETPEGNSIAYEYDDEGIRVSATVDGETTEFLVDKNRPYAQVLEELSSDQLQTFYVYGHDLISQTRNAEQDFYQVDGLGSTRALADEEGNVTDTYDYEAFGELIDSTGDSENSYRFTGEQFDGDLGDYYLRQRFYDQGAGRFIRRDSFDGIISAPVTLHKYIYANVNPVLFTDPSGNITTLQRIAVASRIAATLSNLSIGITYGVLRYRSNNGNAEANEERWLECMDGHFGWAVALGAEALGTVAGGIPKPIFNQPVGPGQSAFTSLARFLSTNRILRPYSTVYANWLKGRVGVFRGTGIKPAAVFNAVYLGASAYVLYTAATCGIIANSHGGE